MEGHVVCPQHQEGWRGAEQHSTGRVHKEEQLSSLWKDTVFKSYIGSKRLWHHQPPHFPVSQNS